jgi:hypothetical protein
MPRWPPFEVGFGPELVAVMTRFSSHTDVGKIGPSHAEGAYHGLKWPVFSCFQGIFPLSV